LNFLGNSQGARIEPPKGLRVPSGNHNTLCITDPFIWTKSESEKGNVNMIDEDHYGMRREFIFDAEKSSAINLAADIPVIALDVPG
jgi:hypothetical protein